MARRPRLTFRRVPRPAATVPADRPADLDGGTADHPPAPGGAEALRTLRTHIRHAVDHRLRCRICRRPPYRHRCPDGEHLERQRREADRAYSRQRHHPRARQDPARQRGGSSAARRASRSPTASWPSTA